MLHQKLTSLSHNTTSSDQLHRRLQRNVVVGLITTSLVIGLITSILLYRSEAKRMETDISYQVELQSVVLASMLSQFKHLALQITSRSRIRQELEKYLHGEISLKSLSDFSIPKLADAMHQTPEIISISRLDNSGTPLFHVGNPTPNMLWPEMFLSDTIQLGIPAEIDGRQLLVISAPIFNRNDKKIGADLITFDFQPIIDIMQAFIQRHQSSSKTYIATLTPGGVKFPLYSDKSKNLSLEQLIKKELQDVLAGERLFLHQVSHPHDRDTMIIVHYPIGDTGWVYFFLETTDKFFAAARLHALYVGLPIFSLAFIGMLLTLFFIRPLTKRIKDEIETVRHLLQQRDKLLEDTQLSEARLQSILDNAASVIYMKDRDGKYLLINKLCEKILSTSQVEIIGKTDYDIYPSEVADVCRDSDLRVITEKKSIILDEQLPNKDGLSHYISIKFPLYDAHNEIYAVCCMSTDITERKQLEQREQLRLQILELMHIDQPLPCFLEKVALLVESNLTGSICSILLLDSSGKYLNYGAAPSLPDFYLEATQSFEISQGKACCATAAYNDEPVYVKNMQQHPYWKPCIDLITRAGLVSCWSEPIHDLQGKILGVFTLYFRESRSPEPAEIEIIKQLAQLTGIAIENKINEKALQDSEERFEFAMRAANDGVWDWDLKSNKVYYSPRWKSMLGYEDDELPHEFSTWEQLIDEQDKVDVLADVEECISGRQASFIDRYRLRHKQGHWVDILAQGLLVRDDAGQAIRFVGTHSDISEQVAAESALKDSESRMRAMFEFAQDGILLTNIKTREIIDVNPAFCDLLGYGRDELITMLIEDIHPEEGLADVMAQFQLRASGESQELAQNIPILRKDGSVFPVDISVSLIEIDDRLCMLGFFRDITERKQSEDRLEAYREDLEAEVIVRTREFEDLMQYNRMLFETSPTGMVLNDMQCRLVDANPAYLNIIGYSEAEAKALSYWDITPIEFVPQEEINIASLNDTGHYGPYIKEYLHKDGHRVTVRINGLYIEQHGKRYIWSSVEDITESQKTQREMMEAKQKAEAALKVKSEFLANMSHEIRTPLNAVLGLARMGERGSSAENSQQIFGWISNAGENLFRIVNDILDFSKIEAGKLTLEYQPFDLVRAVKKVSNLVKAQIAEKGLFLTLDIADDLPVWVKGDELRVEQILLNFLSNAIKFTERGEIKLRALKQDDGIQFQVCDNGIGMTEEQLTTLFNPFEQADSSTTRQYGGTGLGLSICHNLAMMMGGDIQVKSNIGKGSEFYLNIKLELTAPVIGSDSNSLNDTDQRLPGINILIAEDIELNRLVLEDMLLVEGAQITFANNGQQAVDLVKEKGESAFDVILMDIQMPIMDGHQATQIIHKFAPALPVIGLTAHALASEKEHCLRSGMVDHIAKPVDMDKLVETIHKQITAKRRNPVSL